jgi:transposase
LWRKGSFGSHSPAGSRFAERMLTIAATLKQQERNVVDYITAASVASVHGKSAPSLLPNPLSAG